MLSRFGISMVLATFLLSACGGQAPTQKAAPPQSPVKAVQSGPVKTLKNPVATFKTVVAKVEPRAEKMCRDLTNGKNCDFAILVDTNPRSGAVVNAYQTVDGRGQPQLIFTQALLKSVRNADELAFITGHEAAHHISGHIQKQQTNSVVGALAVGVLAAALGADQTSMDMAIDIGADVGARAYSKDHELQADELGTIIAYQSGYDPVKGSQFFNRIPDPGDRFLGTHPANGARMQKVRSTYAQLQNR